MSSNPKKFPENLISLYNEEESIRLKSIEAISKNESFLYHIHTIERSMDTLEYFSREYPHNNDDQLTIQHLGIRLFNESAAALKLLLSGYYQASISIQRNLLEVTFLLDYFTTDVELINQWHKSDKKTRKKQFSPAFVRKKLDDRDSFTERKREKAYTLLCELGVHPTADGFQMLRPIPNSDAHIGPFFENKSMKATLEELAKLAVQAGTIFPRFFTLQNLHDYKMKLAFMENMNQWSERFYKKRSVEQNQIDEIKELIEAFKKISNF